MKVPDLLNYQDDNGIIDYTGDIDAQLYALLEIDDVNRKYIAHTLMERDNHGRTE